MQSSSILPTSFHNSIKENTDIYYSFTYPLQSHDKKIEIWQKQRILNRDKVADVVNSIIEDNNFSSIIHWRIATCFYENTYYIIDGQHRFEAYKTIVNTVSTTLPGTQIPSLVITVNVVKSDLEICREFEMLNRSDPISSFHIKNIRRDIQNSHTTSDINTTPNQQSTTISLQKQQLDIKATETYELLSITKKKQFINKVKSDRIDNIREQLSSAEFIKLLKKKFTTSLKSSNSPNKPNFNIQCFQKLLFSNLYFTDCKELYDYLISFNDFLLCKFDKILKVDSIEEYNNLSYDKKTKQDRLVQDFMFRSVYQEPEILSHRETNDTKQQKEIKSILKTTHVQASVKQTSHKQKKKELTITSIQKTIEQYFTDRLFMINVYDTFVEDFIKWLSMRNLDTKTNNKDTTDTTQTQETKHITIEEQKRRYMTKRLDTLLKTESLPICDVCNCNMTLVNIHNIRYLRPVEQGGVDSYTNYFIACEECNTYDKELHYDEVKFVVDNLKSFFCLD